MAIFIKPKGDAQELVRTLINATMHGARRRVPHWILLSENADFSLATGDAAVDRKAHLRPQVVEGQVVLHLSWRDGNQPDAAIYAAYHARFVETLLTYFHPLCELISIS